MSCAFFMFINIAKFGDTRGTKNSSSMKHYYLKALTLLSCLLLGITVHAHDFEVDGIYYNVVDASNSTVEVTYDSNNSKYYGNVLIPESVTYLDITYSVTDIGWNAFNNCTELTSINIPKSIKKIYYYAFGHCSKLTSVIIPESVEVIYADAFSGCTVLSSVTFNALNCNSFNTIDKNFDVNELLGVNPIFDGCISLTTLKIGDGVTRIPDGIFAGCIGLTSVDIPETTISIGEAAFYGCTGLSSIDIPNSVTSIGGYAFRGCSSLSIVNFNASNCSKMGGTEYGGVYGTLKIQSVFLGCNSLTTINIGDNVTLIPDYAFSDCSSLTSITIPNSVTSIGHYAFQHCAGLTSINIPNCVTSIGSYAFRGCTGLTSIEIPNCVTSIGSYAFRDCSSLSAVNFNASNCSKMGEMGYEDIYSPLGIMSVFYNCNSLTTINIGDKVNLIPNYAFSRCTGLTNITIPNSVTSIGEYAFYDCTKLTSINIPKSVSSIGNNAFNGCTYMNELYIENGENSLQLGYNENTNNGLFYDCPLENLYLGRNLVYSHSSEMGFSPFYKKTELKNITISNFVQTIGNNLFYGCSYISFLSIPSSVTNIGTKAFYNCTALESLLGGENLSLIDNDAFWGCTKLIDTPQCSINQASITLTKLSTSTPYTPFLKYSSIYLKQGEKITGLTPGNSLCFICGLEINGNYCNVNTYDIRTYPFNVYLNGVIGVTSILVNGTYTVGDVTILGTGLGLGSAVVEYDNQNEKIFSNLDPNTNYTMYYSVNTKEGGVYTVNKTFTTGALTWSDEEYQATSTTSARLMTTTNCDATEGTGFEWRRYGAPENLKPNAVACPVVDGMLIGSLRNLNSEAYYEFRPYYTSSSGNTYYGEWTALFTGDANVYFEPEVRTYEDVVVSTNNATLKGYALAGTDDIVSQGFEYWESSVQSGTTNSLNASGNSMIVEVSGISMTTTISDLKYGTTYCYRAFATTSNGTVYGDIEEFTTEKDLSGIENVVIVEDETIEYYNLQGVRVVNPERGLYIKRQGGKTTKVIL